MGAVGYIGLREGAVTNTGGSGVHMPEGGGSEDLHLLLDVTIINDEYQVTQAPHEPVPQGVLGWKCVANPFHCMKYVKSHLLLWVAPSSIPECLLPSSHWLI